MANTYVCDALPAAILQKNRIGSGRVLGKKISVFFADVLKKNFDFEFLPEKHCPLPHECGKPNLFCNKLVFL